MKCFLFSIPPLNRKEAPLKTLIKKKKTLDQKYKNIDFREKIERKEKQRENSQHEQRSCQIKSVAIVEKIFFLVKGQSRKGFWNLF